MPQGGALFMEPGLGKTIVTIRAWEDAGNPPIVVIGPLNAIGVWRDELKQEGYDSYVPSGTRRAKSEAIQYYRGRDPILLNYEALLDLSLERAIIGFLRRHESGSRSWLVFDESQRIKNPTARRTRAALRIARSGELFVAILTGTPVAKNLLDLYSQFKTIEPEIWENQTWTSFKDRYGIFGGFEGRQVVGFQRVPDLKTRIRPYITRFRKDRVLKDLPERQDIEIKCGYRSHSSVMRYERLSNSGVDEEWTTSNPLELSLRLSQLSGRMKVPDTLEVVDDLVDSGRQVVVFYRFREEGDMLWEGLKGRVCRIDGRTSESKRVASVAEFQNGEWDVLLGQIQATSVAITLTASSDVVFHNLTWSHDEHTQARDRVYRIGQKNAVIYRYMQLHIPGANSIDDLIIDALRNKKDLANIIMGQPELLRTKPE